MTTTLEHAGRMVVTSAWGHGNERAGRLRVPAGWVGVAALPNGQGDRDDEMFFLVPEDEYNGRTVTMDAFAVDPARHPVWLAVPDEPGQPVTVLAGNGSHWAACYKRTLYAAAAPHQGRKVGELWHYQAGGALPEHWRVWQQGKGCTIPDYATAEEALAAAGLAFAPYAAVALIASSMAASN